jgi:PadR family transcriptional regulator PadR
VVPSEEGPHRKYYGMTAIGREWLVEQQSQWIDFRNVIDAIIKNDKGVS